MASQQSIRSNELDELLSVLADHQCRKVLAYFRDGTKNVATVADLASEIGTEDDRGQEQVAVRLHHFALPRLADADVLEYDARSDTVRYRGHPDLETLIDAVGDL